jgi:electron transfer flavoprotein alpha/beta subunit
MSDNSVRIAEGVVVRSGDALILTFKDRLTVEQALAIKTKVEGRLPEGTKVTVISNGAEVIVVRGTEGEPA